MIDNKWTPGKEDMWLHKKISEQEVKRNSHKPEFMNVYI